MYVFRGGGGVPPYLAPERGAKMAKMTKSKVRLACDLCPCQVQLSAKMSYAPRVTILVNLVRQRRVPSADMLPHIREGLQEDFKELFMGEDSDEEAPFEGFQQEDIDRANGALGHPDSDFESSDDEILANLATRRRHNDADAFKSDDDYVLTELRPLSALPEIRPGAMPVSDWNWRSGDLRHGTMPLSDVQGLALGVVLPDEPTALDFVELFVKEEDFVEMTEQTNKYVRDFLAAIGELPPRSRFRQWLANGITIGEMKCFIAVTIVMGLVRKDAIEDYWSTDAAISTPFFQNVMPRDKFGNIMSFFHLADNALYMPHGQPGYDPEKKLGSVYANMLQRFTATYKPSQQISIDEGMIGFRGNVKFKQFNPNKPEKYGIKAYKFCDAKNVYCSRFELYTAVPHGVPSGHGSTYDLVFRLAQP